MNILDGVVLVILLLFVIRGVWVGLVRQLAGFIALVAGFVIAGAYYARVAGTLEPWLPSAKIGFLLTFGLLFLVVYLAVIGIGMGLRKVMTVSFLGWFDRLMGGVFGMSKGTAVVLVLFLVVRGGAGPGSPLLRGSILAPYLEKGAEWLLILVRDQRLHEEFRPRKQALDSLLPLPVPGGNPFGWNAEEKAQEE